MTRMDWAKAGISVAASLTLIWTLVWFTEAFNPEQYPGELAYKPDGDLPPSVDIAAVQRGWPGSLDEPGARNRLTAFQREMEGKVPAVAAASTPTAPAAPLDLGALLASADASVGKDKARACISCHDFTSGGPNRVGPNLWGVVGRDVGSAPGFAYSTALAALPGAWTNDQLFEYLASPARAVPGTKMSFGGMRRPEDRAAVVKYLATLGGN